MTIRWKNGAGATLGIILFQDQVNQVAIDVAGIQSQQKPTSSAGFRTPS